MLSIGIYIIIDILLFQEHLKKFSGQLDRSTIFIETIKNTKSFKDADYKIAILQFKLKGNEKQFIISEKLDIVHSSTNKVNFFNKALKNCKEITVYFNPIYLGSEINICKVETDGFQIYDDTGERKEISFTLFFFVMGGAILFFSIEFKFSK